MGYSPEFTFGDLFIRKTRTYVIGVKLEQWQRGGGEWHMGAY